MICCSKPVQSVTMLVWRGPPKSLPSVIRMPMMTFGPTCVWRSSDCKVAVAEDASASEAENLLLDAFRAAEHWAAQANIKLRSSTRSRVKF